jgi:hypothetical protein
MAGRCPDCGGPMKPLAYSEFCPNDCDRKGESLPAWPAHQSAELDDIFLPRSKPDDFSDEEITLDLGPSSLHEDDDGGPIDWTHMIGDLDVDLDGPVSVLMCPDCGSYNTEEFLNCSSGDWHCVPCGHVWYK